MVRVEQLVRWLRANGWKYRLSRGSIEIIDPRIGLGTEYSFSVVENAAIENLLSPYFSADLRGSK